MARTKDNFKKLLQGKEIPLLPLDHKWHQLFTQMQPNSKITRLESQLNKLLKRQGKLNTECKDIRKLKKKLMDEIVIAVDELNQNRNEAINDKKVETNQRLVNECNEKLENYKEELLLLPQQIKELNTELMLATMQVCYDRIEQNTDEIEEITRWINGVRIELKKQVIRKQEKEADNKHLYSFMHDIFGADVLETFDMKYNPMNNQTPSNLTSPTGGIKEEQ